MSLGICNDADNIYILFQFKDPKWLRTASSRGFTIWLDESTKKKQNFGIRYICNPPIDLNQLRNEETGSGSPYEQRRRIPYVHRKVYEQIVILNGTEEMGISIKPDGSQGPAASLGSANGVFIYEFSIPIAHNDSIPHSIGTEVGSDISIGFEFGGMDREKSKQMKQQMGSRRGGGGKGGGGMGGGRGGGKGGMGRSPGRERSQDMMQGGEIWVKCSLASPPVKKSEE
ncbi:MAG: hypothetical protein P9X24_19420 [Candidatus Hatepunaea meridiana]|nr:hypothetical protein [Candidatus Hatepunaea meridiana]